MDPRTLQEIDESPTTVRLVLPAGYPRSLPFEWEAETIDGWTDWAAWVKPNPGATQRIDAAPTVGAEVDGLVTVTFVWTLEQVATIAAFGSPAVWAQTVKVDDVIEPIMAGPVLVTRTARR